jgi:hypothetical protein
LTFLRVKPVRADPRIVDSLTVNWGMADSAVAGSP